MSSYWVARVKKNTGNIMSDKNLSVGTNAIVEYFINDGKIMVKRHINVVSEDEITYYVNTGYLKNTPILKKNIIKIEKIISSF